MNELNLYIMSHERDELPWISCWGTPRTWQYELSYEAILGWSLPCRGPIPPKKNHETLYFFKTFCSDGKGGGGVNDGRIYLSIMTDIGSNTLIIIVIVITVMITRLLFALQLIARKLSTPNIKQKSIVQETRSRSNKVLFIIQANQVWPDENNASD